MSFSRFLSLFVFLLILPVFALARDITITVEDEDLLMPLEGAVITLRDGQQFVCGRDGIAQVNLPDDRQTIVTISYPGYESLRLTIPPAGGNTAEQISVSLRLGGIMQSRELVIEASRPETSETRSGRSVAISERELARTAEIGIIEDVMTSVKLLPGVGYTGMFGAMPSIRGGDPGDLMAAFDGFYLEFPYYWGGAVSIFDPKMVSGARLSHGIFSVRYGHTVSGLLEVTSKTPSPTETEIEAAIGSSAASLNFSIPFNGKGGLLFMGKITYWDTLVWAAQQLSKVSNNETLGMINAITTSPYIRSAAVSGNYRFSPDTEGKFNAFFGADGVGADFETDYDDDDIKGAMKVTADYYNYQGFFIAGLNTSPDPKWALRFSGGIGFLGTITDDSVDNNVTVKYNDSFWEYLDSFYLDSAAGWRPSSMFRNGKTEYTAPDVNAAVNFKRTVFTAQGRADADLDLGNGFIAAFGVQELYSLWTQKGNAGLNFLEVSINNFDDEFDFGDMQPLVNYLGRIPRMTVVMPMDLSINERSHGFTTSVYGLLEYTSPDRRIGGEIGLRIDHLFLSGKNFTAQTLPAFNPRLNIDYVLLKNRGIIDSLDLTFGTGLFSSMDTMFSFMSKEYLGDDMKIKFNRSWTTLIGLKLDFLQSYSFNIEFYYKRVFDRTYLNAGVSGGGIKPAYNFDGVGNVWGFDLQLQKLESRYIDGWISYTFTWVKYMEPSGRRDNFWYWPSFHRFHHANIVLNIKPVQKFNIAVRFGFASGQPRNKVSDVIEPYPSLIMSDGESVIMQKYRRDSWYDPKNRAAWSLPLDIKFSFFPVNRSGRTNMEIYLAGENILSLVYNPTGNTRFNEYTGREDTAGSGTSGFDLPIPMISFGFKWRY